MQQYLCITLSRSTGHSGICPTISAGNVSLPPTRLGIGHLDHIVHAYVASSVAPSTFSCYHSALNWYLDFCHHFQLSSFPLNPINVTHFVVYLAQTCVAYPSIQSYLSGIRFMQLVQGLPDPCLSTDATLRCVLRGIHHLPVGTQCPPRLPVTPERLHDSW